MELLAEFSDGDGQDESAVEDQERPEARQLESTMFIESGVVDILRHKSKELMEQL